MSQARCSC